MFIIIVKSILLSSVLFFFFFFFNDTATTEIYTFPTRRSSDLVSSRARPRPRRRCPHRRPPRDRKSTRLNSSHSQISYAVFCLKKKKKQSHNTTRLRKTKQITLS